MSMPQTQSLCYPVQVLTTHSHIQGTMEPIGPVINYLNDVDRRHIPLLEATVSPLTTNPLGQVARSQLIIPKNDIVALYLDDAAARSGFQLLRRIERSIFYMPSLVCRAEFHLGIDTRWQDMLGLLVGDFFAVTNATVFPLIALPGPFPQQTDLLVLNRLHVQMLHPDQA